MLSYDVIEPGDGAEVKITEKVTASLLHFSAAEGHRVRILSRALSQKNPG